MFSVTPTLKSLRRMMEDRAQERQRLEREASSEQPQQVSTRSSKSSKVLSSGGVTREKEGAEDLGVVTRARKRRMAETSGIRNVQKEVMTSRLIHLAYSSNSTVPLSQLICKQLSRHADITTLFVSS